MSDVAIKDKACCGPGYASPSDAIKAPIFLIILFGYLI
jgi:hypothetical protein